MSVRSPGVLLYASPTSIVSCVFIFVVNRIYSSAGQHVSLLHNKNLIFAHLRFLWTGSEAGNQCPVTVYKLGALSIPAALMAERKVITDRGAVQEERTDSSELKRLDSLSGLPSPSGFDEDIKQRSVTSRVIGDCPVLTNMDTDRSPEFPVGSKSRSKYRQIRQETRAKPTSPDAFLSLRIQSPQIRASFEEVQQVLVEKNPKLKGALVSLDKLHITLMVMKLGKDVDRLEVAKKALTTACKNITEHFTGKLDAISPLELSFKGLDSFGENVVFAPLDPENQETLKVLHTITNIVRTAFVSAGIESTDLKERFTPHLTVAKLSQLPRRKAFYKVKLKRKFYEDLVTKYHGSHKVFEIELLSMKLPPKNGYYHKFSSSNLLYLP